MKKQSAYIDMKDVLLARSGSEAAKRIIFEMVFTDCHGVNKIKPWLHGAGLPERFHSEMTSRVYEQFSNLLMKDYRHSQISFEVFCWQKFAYLLTDFYRQKAAKFNQNLKYVDPLPKTTDDDSHGLDLTNETDDWQMVDMEMSIVKMDFEIIIKDLNPLHRMISRFIFFNHMEKKSVCRILKCATFEFELAKNAFVTKMQKYLEGKL